MKNKKLTTIRYQLFFYFFSVVLFFYVLLWIANALFAERYYTMEKEQDLYRVAKRLKSSFDNTPYDPNTKDMSLDNYALKLLTDMERAEGVNIAFSDPNGPMLFPKSIVYSYDRPENTSTNDITSTIIKVNPSYKILSKKSDGSFYAIGKDPFIGLDTLLYQLPLKNGIGLLVYIPISTISQGVTVANAFTTIVGIITLLFTTIMSFFISDKFTKPIMKINYITKKISSLDFSESLEVNGKNELSELSQNINLLSLSLENSISQLQFKNTELSADIDRTKQIDKMRREFISNVSHELKTPIFLIQGYAEGLLKNVINSEEKRRFYANIILEESEKMHELVKDLLELSRLESGIENIFKQNYDLNDQIKKVIQKYEYRMQQQKIEITYTGVENALIIAEYLKIEQVLTNFINNAIEHVDNRKKITITLQSIEDGYRFSVFNYGKLISKEQLSKIWNSFYKIDQSRNRELGGAGLGLSIVKAILNLHDFKYGVYNETDGVVFWFESLST